MERAITSVRTDVLRKNLVKLRELIREVYREISPKDTAGEQQVLRDYIDENGTNFPREWNIISAAPSNTYEWYLQIVKLSLTPGDVGSLAKQAWQTLDDGKLMLFTLLSDAFKTSREDVVRVLCSIAREALHRYMSFPGVSRTLDMIEAWTTGDVSTSQVRSAVDELARVAGDQADIQIDMYITQANILFQYMVNLMVAKYPQTALSNFFSTLNDPNNWTFHRPVDADEVARLVIHHIPVPAKVQVI